MPVHCSKHSHGHHIYTGKKWKLNCPTLSYLWNVEETKTMTNAHINIGQTCTFCTEDSPAGFKLKCQLLWGSTTNHYTAVLPTVILHCLNFEYKMLSYLKRSVTDRVHESQILPTPYLSVKWVLVFTDTLHRDIQALWIMCIVLYHSRLWVIVLDLGP